MILDGTGNGKDVDTETVRQWSGEHGVLWIHMDVADDASADWLAEQSDLPAVAVEALLAGETRPRSTLSDHGLLIVLRGVNTIPALMPRTWFPFASG